MVGSEVVILTTPAAGPGPAALHSDGPTAVAWQTAAPALRTLPGVDPGEDDAAGGEEAEGQEGIEGVDWRYGSVEELDPAEWQVGATCTLACKAGQEHTAWHVQCSSVACLEALQQPGRGWFKRCCLQERRSSDTSLGAGAFSPAGFRVASTARGAVLRRGLASLPRPQCLCSCQACYAPPAGAAALHPNPRKRDDL